MKQLPLLLSVAALLVAVATLLVSLGERAGSEEVLGLDSPKDQDGRLVRLAEEVRRQGETLRHLEEQARVAPARMETKPFEVLSPPRRPASPREGGERDAQWYLDEYLRSFENGGAGSEYFRLAVEAHAHVLLDDLVRLILDGGRVEACRVALINMLGQPRFRGDRDVIRTLLQVIELRADGGTGAALAALSGVGDQDTAALLAERVWDLPAGPLQQAGFKLVVTLGGGDANRLLFRLLLQASDDATRLQLVMLAHAGGDAGAVDLFDQASTMSQPVRLGAAQRVGAFRSEEMAALVDRWIAREQDAQVRAALKDARRKQSEVPSWHPMKATGPPDVADARRDSPDAWASLEADGGREWLELTYARPLRANMVRIFEVLAPGGVVEVVTFDTSGKATTVWHGRDPTTTPSVFEVVFPTTVSPVRNVRIILDTRRGSGWNEIDAVELVGPDGRAWASNATASSTYAR